MSTIQNIKNFIRHGKQARLVTPHSEPTTDVSAVHAEQQPQPLGQYSPDLGAFDTGDVRGNGGHGQATQQNTDTQVKRDRSVEIERLVQEERTSRSKMPQYPGLDRWILLEKMGDGAFSNVYRAKDSTGELGEVAIKVVRKFEMNSNQVGRPEGLAFLFPRLCSSLLVSVSSLLGGDRMARVILSMSREKTSPISSFVVRPPSSQRQKGSMGCGGAHYLLHHASPRIGSGDSCATVFSLLCSFIPLTFHSSLEEELLLIPVCLIASEYPQGSPDYAQPRPPQHRQVD